MKVSIWNRIMRAAKNQKNRRMLQNREFSMVANNCNGAFICHDLGLRYHSPFVNLWMLPGDYLKLLKDLEGYLNSELTFTEEAGIEYPVGVLRDVKIYFQHYKSEEEAREKWKQRLARMNYDNLFVLLTESDGCTYEMLQEFDKLPYCNKAALVHKPYPELKSAFHLTGYEDRGSVGECYHYKGPYTGEKIYDAFDYVSWLNGM